MSGNKKQLLLEQLVLGELPVQRQEKFLAEFDTAEKLESAKTELNLSTRDILAEYPPVEMAARIRERIEQKTEPKKKTRVLNFFKYAIPAAAAAVFILFLPLVLNNGIQNETVRFKGGGQENINVKGLIPRIFVYRQSLSGVAVLHDGDIAMEGDILQVSYIAGMDSYGFVFSVDGNDAVTFHYPTEGKDLKLETGGERYLPTAYKLDNAPYFEDFYFLSSLDKDKVEYLYSSIRSINSASRVIEYLESALKTGDLRVYVVRINKQ